MEQYTNYAVEQTCALLAIDSPSGDTHHAADYAMNELKRLGFDPSLTRKGGVLVCLNPDLPEDNALLLEAHLDTLGGMVTQICGNRLKLTNLGGMNPNNGEAEKTFDMQGEILSAGGDGRAENGKLYVEANGMAYAVIKV